MSSFLHVIAKDDGIYCLVRELRLHAAFHSALKDTLSALKRVQPSSLNIQTPLQKGTLLVSALYRK